MKNIVDSNLEVLKHEELRRSTKSEHFKLQKEENIVEMKNEEKDSFEQLSNAFDVLSILKLDLQTELLCFFVLLLVNIGARPLIKTEAMPIPLAQHLSSFWNMKRRPAKDNVRQQLKANERSRRKLLHRHTWLRSGLTHKTNL